MVNEIQNILKQSKTERRYRPASWNLRILAGGFAIVSNDDSVGRPPSRLSPCFLTSIHGRDCLFHMAGGFDPTLSGSVSRLKRKANSYKRLDLELPLVMYPSFKS